MLNTNPSALATSAGYTEPLHLTIAALVAQYSGYTHDLGKASEHFQEKLKTSCTAAPSVKPISDPIRHEWLSAWLMPHAASSTWSDASMRAAWNNLKKQNRSQLEDSSHFASTPTDAMRAARWAVATHHGAMGGNHTAPNGIDASRHIRSAPTVKNQTLDLCFSSTAAPHDHDRWNTLWNKLNTLHAHLNGMDHSPLMWQHVLRLGRAALILADHKISSMTFLDQRESGIVYANTKPVPIVSTIPASSIRRKPKKSTTPARYLDQPLSWHLHQVGDTAKKYAAWFDSTRLPLVEDALSDAVIAAKAPQGSRFEWQDHAVDHVTSLAGGKLVFNVASTGSGKTLANFKMVLAMRPGNTRVAAVFNLRSLTQQTYTALSHHLSMLAPTVVARNVACLMGESLGTEGAVSHEDEDDAVTTNVDMQSCTTVPPTWMADMPGGGNDVLTKLIAAPILISTMDWIVAAGEPGEQARHAQALLRVATSDLILDEVDSYDTKAMVAVLRVVHLAAAFGRNVVVSSATLNPVIAEALAATYATGWKEHQVVTQEATPWHTIIAQDHHDIAVSSMQSPDAQQVRTVFLQTMEKVAIAWATTGAIQRFRLGPVDGAQPWSNAIEREAYRLHDQWKQKFSMAQTNGIEFSVGLVRVAHVEQCRLVADRLRASGNFVVCAYHARDVARFRAHKEQGLDEILNRKTSAWQNALLKWCPELKNRKGDVRLVVVATPVEEVGRDHDFDWCIIEPSSMHSIIQTAGRVNRHRRIPLDPGQHNVVVLDINAAEHNAKKYVFQKPGLEGEGEDGCSTHPSHSMATLLKGSSDALGVGLMVGRHKVLFAQYDEHAVAHQLRHALPVLRQDPGFNMAWMLKEVASTYPLREKNWTYTWKLTPGGNVYQVPDLLGKHVGTWTHTRPIPPGTWLSDWSMFQNGCREEYVSWSSTRPLTIGSIQVEWHGFIAT